MHGALDRSSLLLSGERPPPDSSLGRQQVVKEGALYLEAASPVITDRQTRLLLTSESFISNEFASCLSLLAHLRKDVSSLTELKIFKSLTGLFSSRKPELRELPKARTGQMAGNSTDCPWSPAQLTQATAKVFVKTSFLSSGNGEASLPNLNPSRWSHFNLRSWASYLHEQGGQER